MRVEVEVAECTGERSVQQHALIDALSIGRSPECAVWLYGEHVSRRHAVVQPAGTMLRVEDVSSNGTLAGETLLRQCAAEVPWGTPILVGTYTLHIRPVVENEVSEPPAVDPRPNATLLEFPERRQDFSALQAVAAAEQNRPAADAALRREIHKRLLEHLDLATTEAKRLDDPSFRPRVLSALRRIVKELEPRLPPDLDQARLIGEMADEALGLGPLEALLDDPAVTEILVVDASTIYVEKHGRLERSAACFTDDDRVRAVIERIVTPLGRRIDESSPLVDARLSDGSRVNAIIKPLAIKGSCITIRKFAKVPLTLGKLQQLSAISPAMGRFLTRCVVAKKNIVISGGTGSGKTTLLNVLSAAIPAHERIITIEDSAELQLLQPHVVSLETRPSNMEGKGEYTIRDLVKNALRMRPDRIVVGECRGGETLDMLQAMNTGHEGSLTTTHANSPTEALSRLETLSLMAGLELPARAIREQIAASVHLVAQQTRFSDGTRKVNEITEICGLDRNGEFQTRSIFQFERSGTGPEGEVLGEFAMTGHLPSFLDQFIVRGLVAPGEPYL
ncbi:MAG TPA: ATPase, T2SS/T4P/T4SS family [Polyangiaceae bacterium]|nr:ATPase, T2SS/T4P/T4SS family [Polyangiaceae bacterium]